MTTNTRRVARVIIAVALVVAWLFLLWLPADAAFSSLVYVAYPAAVLYPSIYLARAKWWRTWVGQALLIKALGIFLLLTVSALFQFFGPDYFARDFVRVTGMTLLTVGLWYALIAMLREFRRSNRATR